MRLLYYYYTAMIVSPVVYNNSISYMMKVKINKVIGAEEFPGSKHPPIIIEERKYVIAPTSIEQNYTGYPLLLYFVITLPQGTHDYEYLRVDIKAQHAEFKNICTKKQQVIKVIKRGNLKRDALFQFTPSLRGNYNIIVDCYYRAQFFVQGSQTPPEKKQTNSLIIKCEEPFQIKELILSEDKALSITFPLFLQYSIESKIPNQELLCDVEFNSEKFKFKQLHNQRRIKLKKEEIYYLMLEIEPKSIKEVISQKGITIGTLSIKYGNKCNYDKKTALKTSNKYVFFKAYTITKEVPKKDIVEIQAVFAKIYNVNFNLGNLKLVIDQKEMPQVKILKTSVDGINLDQNKEVRVIFTVICLKSGPVHLKGISLQGGEDITVYFINELTLNVGIEPERKAEAILQNTSEFNVETLI